MASTRAKLCHDERWGYHYDIGKDGAVEIPFKNKMHQWTLEMWIKLKSYPIIHKSKAGEESQSPPTLLNIGTVKARYNDKQIAFKDSYTQQKVYVNYPEGDWFQLAICNGRPDQLGHATGDIYINGKNADHTMIFPTDIDVMKLGNQIMKGQRILINPSYDSESCLGVVRIYNTVLDKHQVYNNYLAQARQYGLLMDTRATPTSTNLVMELIPNRDHLVHGHWLTTKDVLRERKVQNMQDESNKNKDKKYMSDTHISELTRLLKSLSPARDNVQQQIAQVAEHERINREQKETAHRVAQVEAQARAQAQAQAQIAQAVPVPPAVKGKVDSNIIVLSQNPELFFQQLQQAQVDNNSNPLLTKGRTPNSNDYQSIFDNPFKLKLLVSYMQSNPEHFLTVLKSDNLSQEQLILLSNALSTQKGGNHHGAFGNLLSSAPAVNGNYYVALNLLDNKIRANQPRRSLQNSADQIANIMEYQHERQRIQENSMEKHAILQAIRDLNRQVGDARQRTHALEKLLGEQKDLMGVIIAKNKKCVGTIDRKGKMHHCDHKDAVSPYKILVRPDTYGINLANILKQHKLHGSTIEELLKKPDIQVLGQTVNTDSKTIGAIVRLRGSRGNHYLPTKETEPSDQVPILAILKAAAPKQKQEAKPDKLFQKPATASGCPSGKCPPGFEQKMDEEKLAQSWIPQQKDLPNIDKGNGKIGMLSAPQPVVEKQQEPKGMEADVGAPALESDEDDDEEVEVEQPKKGKKGMKGTKDDKGLFSGLI